MRLSLKKGAHAVLSGATCRKFGASRSFFARCGIPQLFTCDRSQPRSRTRRTGAPINVRPTRPGLPWSVHGPKTNFSNAFTTCATTLGRFATVRWVVEQPDDIGVRGQPRLRFVAARPHGRPAAPTIGSTANGPGRRANRPTDSANRDTALATG
jgi:hypothetical protein